MTQVSLPLALHNSIAAVKKPQEFVLMKSFQDEWPWLCRCIVWSDTLRSAGYAPGSRWILRWKRSDIRSEKTSIVLDADQDAVAALIEKKQHQRRRVEEAQKKEKELRLIAEGPAHSIRKAKNNVAIARKRLREHRGNPMTPSEFFSKNSVHFELL